MNRAAWQRWTLLAALFALGTLYVLAYAFFRINSHDFLAEAANRRAVAYAINHPTDLPVSLEFTSASANVALLGSGWYESAPDGAWSAADDSWIAIPLGRHPAIGAKIVATPFLARHHKQIEIAAEADSHLLGKWQRRWTDSVQPNFEFCIPATESPAPQLLHIHVDHVEAPFDIGSGADLRLLGLKLTSIQFKSGCKSESG